MNINWEHLKTFITIIDEGSFVKAADKLLLTQPAVSLQMKALEENFEGELFRYEGRKKILTNLGKKIYDTAAPYINQMQADFDILLRKDEFLGEVKITGPSEILFSRITPKLKKIKQIPGLKVNLMPRHVSKVNQHVLDEDVDFGIVTEEFLTPNVIAKQLFKDSIGFIYNPQHFTMSNDNLCSWERFSKIPLLVYEPKDVFLTTWLKTYFKKRTLEECLTILIVPDWRVIIQAVAAGIGCAFFPSSYLDLLSANIEWIDLRRISKPSSIFLIYTKNCLKHKKNVLVRDVILGQGKSVDL